MNVKLTRHLTAWIACFAVLLAALAPSISHMVSAARDAAAQSSQGHRHAATEMAGMGHEMAHEHHSPSSAPAEKSFHFEHCPFCFTHGGSVGLPPMAAVTLHAASAGPLRPPLYYQSSRPLFSWAAPQSRAPPALS